LAATWGLPLGIVEAVALHHYPTKFFSQNFCPLTAVHAANIFEHEHSVRGVSGPPPFDMAYLTAMGLAKRVPVWRDACRQVASNKSAA
jgi:hypothetical protein